MLCCRLLNQPRASGLSPSWPRICACCKSQLGNRRDASFLKAQKASCDGHGVVMGYLRLLISYKQGSINKNSTPNVHASDTCLSQRRGLSNCCELHVVRGRIERAVEGE